MAFELSKVRYLTKGSVMARPVALLADIVYASRPASKRYSRVEKNLQYEAEETTMVVEEVETTESQPINVVMALPTWASLWTGHVHSTLGCFTRKGVHFKSQVVI